MREDMDGLVSEVSHELLTPLGTIIGMSDLLLEGAFGSLSNRQQGLVRDIKDGGGQLLGLIRSLVDVARSRSAAIENTEVDVAGLIDNAVALVRERCLRHDVAVEKDLPPALPIVHGDRRKTLRAIYTLLAKAVKSAPDGSSVGVGAEADSTSLRVWVEGAPAPDTWLNEVREAVESQGGLAFAGGVRSGFLLSLALDGSPA